MTKIGATFFLLVGICVGPLIYMLMCLSVGVPIVCICIYIYIYVCAIWQFMVPL